MRDFREPSNPPRQRGPALSWSGVAVGVLALLALGLGGCGTLPSVPCSGSWQCGPGLECVHWKGGYEVISTCEKTCPVEADVCDDGQRCGCPDCRCRGKGLTIPVFVGRRGRTAHMKAAGGMRARNPAHEQRT